MLTIFNFLPSRPHIALPLTQIPAVLTWVPLRRE